MKVISIVVNNPLFIELQYLTLKKFLLTPYEFIIFNDAKHFPDYTNGNDVYLRNEIRIKCKSLNIICIDIPNDIHLQITSGSERHSYGMNIITEFMKRYPDEYLILDSDMFLIDYLDIDIYRKYNTAIVLQQRDEIRLNYIWPGLCYFNNNNDYSLLRWDVVEHTDNGGASCIWLKTQLKDNETFPTSEEIKINNNHNNHNIYYIRHLWSLDWNEDDINDNDNDNSNIKKLLNFFKEDLRNKNGKFFSEIYDNKFLHYRAGCNWLGEGIEFHKKNSEKLKEAILMLL